MVLLPSTWRNRGTTYSFTAPPLEEKTHWQLYKNLKWACEYFQKWQTRDTLRTPFISRYALRPIQSRGIQIFLRCDPSFQRFFFLSALLWGSCCRLSKWSATTKWRVSCYKKYGAKSHSVVDDSLEASKVGSKHFFFWFWRPFEILYETLRSHPHFE